MRAEKKVIDQLNKCYAVAEFDFDGKRHIITAAEKTDPCYMYDLEGNKEGTLWEGPGGVMTLCQYPLSEDDDPVLLATQKFYSPNDSADAKIVYYTRENGEWKCHVLCDLPFVHRFGVAQRGGVWYLIACTLKSAHAFRDDWTCPGRIWVAELPENIREYGEDNQLKLQPLVSGLYKNHGFCRCEENGYGFFMVGTENGVYRVDLPEEKGGEWKAECVLEVPTSDMLYQDYDGDGNRELLILSPFHGDTLSVYKDSGEGFKEVFTCGKKMPFLHAIWGAELFGRQVALIGNRQCHLSSEQFGRQVALIGNRQEDRELLAVYHDGTDYVIDVLDAGAGPANCMHFRNGNRDMILAANRETDEVALYTLYE